MKLQTRNIIITILMFISMTLFLGMAIICFHEISTNNFSLPTYNPYTSFQNFFLTKMNYQAIVISIFMIILYVFLTLLYVNISFEKTQSTEIIYIALFLAGCLLESVRLLFPMYDLWNFSSSKAVFISKVVVCGRLLCPASLLFSVIYSNFETRQYVEQNIVILLAFAIGSSIFVPMNSNFILPLGYVQIAIEMPFDFLRFSVLIMTCISLLIKNKQSQNKLKFPFEFIIMIAGYLLLTLTYNFIFLVLGTAAIFTGTYYFLRNLHSQYLWN